jgi:hypothetical protein
MSIQEFIDYINNSNIDKSLQMRIEIDKNIIEKYLCGYFNSIEKSNCKIQYNSLWDETTFDIIFKD